MPAWFETVFLLLVFLSVMHYAWVFYSKLLRTTLRVVFRLAAQLFGRRSSPVRYSRQQG